MLTEKRKEQSPYLHEKSIDEILQLMNDQDKNGDTRVAILTLMFNIHPDIAQATLEKHQGNFIKALNECSAKC